MPATAKRNRRRSRGLWSGPVPYGYEIQLEMHFLRNLSRFAALKLMIPDVFYRGLKFFRIISASPPHNVGNLPAESKSNQPHNMKLLLTALCASFMVVPAFASECEKGKCDKDKKEEGTVLLAGDCDKCKKGEEKKEEGALALTGDCEKGKCDKDKKEEGTLA